MRLTSSARQRPSPSLSQQWQMCAGVECGSASSNKGRVEECVTLSQSCSSAPVVRSLPCRTANDRHVSRQRDCCAAHGGCCRGFSAQPRGADTAELQQSDSSPNPGQVCGCLLCIPQVWNKYKAGKQICEPGGRRGWRAFQPLPYKPWRDVSHPYMKLHNI